MIDYSVSEKLKSLSEHVSIASLNLIKNGALFEQGVIYSNLWL